MGEPIGGAERRCARARRGLAAALTLCAACTARPPAAGTRLPAAPDLSGAAVLVFPVQPGPLPARDGDAAAAPEPLDTDERRELSREVAFWLRERGEENTRWIGPAELARVVARSPGLDIDLHALDVDRFRRREVRRIGDPLFGDVYRLGTLADAGHALLPVAAARVAGPEAGTARVEIAAALVDARDGTVLWFGVVAGAPGPASDPAVLAGAAQALARALIP